MGVNPCKLAKNKMNAVGMERKFVMPTAFRFHYDNIPMIYIMG